MARIGKQELAKIMAERGGVSEKAAQKSMDAMIEAISEGLASGDIIELPGFMKFYADDVAPSSRVNASTGERTVRPAGRTVRAVLSKAFKDRAIENNKVKGVGIILATAPDNRFAMDLKQILVPEGIQCIVQPDLAGGVKELGGRAKLADFIVVTPSISEVNYEETVMYAKSRKVTAFLPILRGAFEVEKYEKPTGFKILPDHIFSSAVEVAKQIRGDLDRWREEKHYFKRQFRLKSASGMETINALFKAFDRLAGRILPKADENYKMLSALHEAIENAAQHGNRGDKGKYVSIEWIEDRKNVRITVEDEGQGFDYAKAMEAGTLKTAEAVRKHLEAGAGTGGLGVKLMQEVFDEVEYTDGGRKLHLLKARSQGK
ncbi:MAG: ATP-binding protein [Planctomycetes bacterium]|nr:ATP-binding protein [Planctomycetota bacterium]